MSTREIEQLIALARTWAGWRVAELKKGWILYPPDKTLAGITIHKTPSDHRAWKNIISRLRRAGAPV